MTDRAGKIHMAWSRVMNCILFYSILFYSQADTNTDKWNDIGTTRWSLAPKGEAANKSIYENWIVCLFTAACDMNMSILFIYHHIFHCVQCSVYTVLQVSSHFFHSFCLIFFLHFQYFERKRKRKKRNVIAFVWYVTNHIQ